MLTNLNYRLTKLKIESVVLALECLKEVSLGNEKLTPAYKNLIQVNGKIELLKELVEDWNKENES